jgi:DNA-binding response OmpR family regulator
MRSIVTALLTSHYIRSVAMLALRSLGNDSYTSAPTAVPEFNLIAAGLRLSDAQARVTAHGVPLLLRPIEFRLLRFLMSQPERVQSRGAILQQAWGRKVVVGERTIDVHIRRLRVVLQPFGMDGWIKTHPTRGYSFSTAN